MDNTTLNVRRMYNAYPYPDENTQVRMDAFPSLFLSYLDRPAVSRPLRILDAGCGTGAGTVAVAALNPDAEVVAVDISPKALSLAKARAEQEGIENLQFIEGDILDPHHLPCTDQGYDVIMHPVYCTICLIPEKDWLIFLRCSHRMASWSSWYMAPMDGNR